MNSPVTIKLIVESVATFFNIGSSRIIGRERNNQVDQARILAVWLSTELTSFSTTELGRLFGGRDHSTICNARNRANELILSDNEFAQWSRELKQIINGLAYCDNKTWQKSIQDHDIQEIANRALNSPFGRISLSYDEMVAVLNFAAAGSAVACQFRIDMIEGKTAKAKDIFDAARQATDAWRLVQFSSLAHEKPRAVEQLQTAQAELSKAFTYYDQLETETEL